MPSAVAETRARKVLQNPCRNHVMTPEGMRLISEPAGPDGSSGRGKWQRWFALPEGSGGDQPEGRTAAQAQGSGHWALARSEWVLRLIAVLWELTGEHVRWGAGARPVSGGNRLHFIRPGHVRGPRQVVPICL